MPHSRRACYTIARNSQPIGCCHMTLRRRLTIAYVGFFAIALIALDIGLYLIVRQALYSNIDSDLERGAQYLQDGFTNSNEQLRASNNQRLKDYFGANSFILTEQTISGFDATNLKFQVYQPNGELVAKSANVQYTIHVDDDPLTCVVRGTGRILDDFEKYRSVLTT